MLRQSADLLRQRGVLLRQNVKLLFRRQFRLDKPGIDKLLVIAFGFAHGFVRKPLHLAVFFDGDTDLPRALHVLHIYGALPVGESEKRRGKLLLHEKIPLHPKM